MKAAYTFLGVDYQQGGTTLLSNLWQTTVQFPVAVNLTVYIILIVLALAGFYFIWRRGKAAGFVMRWTTQDILILAILGVLLEVYDNLIGDQFITPILKMVPARPHWPRWPWASRPPHAAQFTLAASPSRPGTF